MRSGGRACVSGPGLLAGTVLLSFALAAGALLAVGLRASADHLPTHSVYYAASNGIGASGIDFSHAGFRTNSPYIQYEDTSGSGACWGDYDADGDPDLFVTNGVQSETDPATSHLYQNSGGSFSDVTTSAGVALRGSGQGCAWGDYNNDGYPDLFVAFAFVPHALQRNVLLRNNQDGTFRDVTGEAGVDGRVPGQDCHKQGFEVPAGSSTFVDGCYSTSAAWIDYDNDGDLDLYVANYADLYIDSCKVIVSQQQANPVNCTGQRNRLYRNNADGTFSSVGAALGVEYNEDGTKGRSLGVVAVDVDSNGWTDLYVSNDVDANALYVNGGGWFSSVAKSRGADNRNATSGGARAGMGIDAQDVTNDGRVDLLSSHLRQEDDAVYVQRADGSFEDKFAAWEMRVPASGTPSATADSRWGGGYVDFNNDGWKDYLVVTGDQSSGQPGPVLLYLWNSSTSRLELVENTKDVTFHRAGIGSEPGTGDVIEQNMRAVAFADVDDDGDVDAYVTVLQNDAHAVQKPKLIKFHFRGDDHAANRWKDNWWLGIKLVGVTTNRDALGAIVKVTAGSTTQWFQATSGSFQADHDARIHVGLGANKDGTVEVMWPAVGGATYTQTVPFNVSSETTTKGKVITITESRDTAPGAVRIKTTRATHESVTLEWTPSFASDFKQYVVERSMSSEFTSTTATTIVEQLANRTTITGLAETTTYHFRVKVVDRSGVASAWSAPATVATTSKPPAKVTLNLPTAVTATGLNLSWTASDAVLFKEYQVYVSRDSRTFRAESANLTARVAVRGTPWKVLSDLRDATDYHFRVVVEATDGARSDPSDVVTATTANAPPPRVDIAMPAAEDLQGGRAVVRWNRSAAHDFARYEATIRGASLSTPMKELVASRATLTATFSGLADNTEYEAVVTVVDVGGLASAESVVAFRTPDAPPPALTILPVLPANLTKDSAKVVWVPTAIADFARYELAIADHESFATPLKRVNVTSKATISHTFTLLRDATPYWVRVSVVDTTGAVSPPATVRVTTANAAPPAPTAAPRVEIGPELGAVTIRWEPSLAHDFARYEVHLGASAEFTPSPRTVTSEFGDRARARLTLLGLSGVAHARVVVVDEGGLASPSPAARVDPVLVADFPLLRASSPAPRVVVFEVVLPAALRAATEVWVREAVEPPGPALAVGTGASRVLQVANAPVGKDRCFVLLAAIGSASAVSEPECLDVVDGTADDVRRALLVQRPLSNAGERTAAISWWTPEAVTNRVLLGTDALRLDLAPGEPVTAPEGGGFGHKLELRGLAPATRYHWKVAVTSADGFEAATPLDEFRTRPDRTAPGTVERLAVAADSTGLVKVSWAPARAADVRGYLVHRAGADGGFALVGSVLAPGTQFTEALDPGGYRYRVVALDREQNAIGIEEATEAEILVPDRALAPIEAVEAAAVPNATTPSTSSGAAEAAPTTLTPAESRPQGLASRAIASVGVGAAVAVALAVAAVASDRRRRR